MDSVQVTTSNSHGECETGSRPAHSYTILEWGDLHFYPTLMEVLSRWHKVQQIKYINKHTQHLSPFCWMGGAYGLGLVWMLETNCNQAIKAGKWSSIQTVSATVTRALYSFDSRISCWAANILGHLHSFWKR